MRKVTLLVLAAGSATSLAQGQDVSWNNAAGGSWNVAANWSPMNVPDTSGERAVIALDGSYVVTLNTSVGVGGLELTGSDASLHVLNNQALRLLGDVVNDRTIMVNPSAGLNGTYLQFEASGTLGGTGNVVLNAGSSLSTAVLRSVGTGVSVTNAPGHTIRGTGAIQGIFVNGGLVNADASGRVLDVAGTTTNDATMSATGGGILRITSNAVDQGSASGRMLADGGTVQLYGAIITGGLIQAVNGGTTRVDSTTSYVYGVTVEGPLDIANNQYLVVRGAGLTNSGVITVNDTAGTNGTYLQFEVDGTLDGAGAVVLNASPALSTATLRSAGTGSVVRNGSAQLIRGTGLISGAFANNGVVNADRNGLVLEVASTTTNNGTIGATNGAILRVTSNSFTQGAGGRLRADGGVIELSGATVTNGDIEAAGGGSTRVVTTTSIVSDATVTGPLDIANNESLLVRGSGITNNGVITVNDSAGANSTYLQFEVDGTLGGSGEVLLNANASNVVTASLRSAGTTAVVRNGASHTVRGTGSITGTLVNEGIVDADVDGHVLELGAATTNNSTIAATHGGILKITSDSLTQGAGGRIRADAGLTQLSGALVRGGLIEAVAGGRTQVVTTTSYVYGVTVAGPLAIANDQVLIVRGSGLTNNGVITVNETGGINGTYLQFEVNGTLDGSGAVVLNASNNLETAVLRPVGTAIAILNGPSHTIAGRGRIRTPFTNAGHIDPGALSGGSGLLEITGPWSNQPSAQIHADIGGDVQGVSFDHLSSTGAATLAGTLSVALVNNFLPARGTSFDIITAPSITGTFDMVSPPELPLDYGFARIQYTPTAVRVRIPLCRADWNAVDGLNSQDFFDFLMDFFNGDSDYNRDHTTNSQDFFDFLTDFFSPCLG